MTSERYLTARGFYAGFGALSRPLLLAWMKWIVAYKDLAAIQSVMQALNHHLETNNGIVFFDHHYAFDTLPLALGLVRFVETVQGVLIPYAAHLDMGLGRKGEFSIRYKLRTAAFHWLMRSLTRTNPQLQFLPVVREFEMSAPKLRERVARDYSSASASYLRAFVRTFSQNQAGQVCFLTPFSGIGFPGKPVMHPQLHRSMKLVQGKSAQPIPYFLVGAYPGWRAYSSYYAPLLSPHVIAARGPFWLPIEDYEQSQAALSAELNQLRAGADFTPPDYERVLTK